MWSRPAVSNRQTSYPWFRARDERLATDRHRVLVRSRRMHRAAHLLAEEPELLDRRRAANVGRHEVGIAFFFQLQVASELGDRGRLSRSLQPHEHHRHGRRGGEIEPTALFTHQPNQFLVNDLDDLLAWGERLQDVLAEGLATNRVRKLLDDLDVDVGLEEREADFAKRFLEVRLADARFAPELLEDRFELVAEGLEHRRSSTQLDERARLEKVRDLVNEPRERRSTLRGSSSCARSRRTRIRSRSRPTRRFPWRLPEAWGQPPDLLDTLRSDNPGWR